MPTYEFKCKKCGHCFEMAESISQHDKHREKCPECGSKSIQNVISAGTDLVPSLVGGNTERCCGKLKSW
jgi:putative FmdB family regulatory protein